MRLGSPFGLNVEWWQALGAACEMTFTLLHPMVDMKLYIWLNIAIKTKYMH